MDRKLMDAGLAARRAVPGKMHGLGVHFRGARRNGLTGEELRPVPIRIAVYCGIPVGIDCFRAAKQVLADVKGKD